MLGWIEDTLLLAVMILLMLAGTGLGIFSALGMFSGVVGIFAYGIGYFWVLFLGFVGLMAAVALWRAAIKLLEWMS